MLERHNVAMEWVAAWIIALLVCSQVMQPQRADGQAVELVQLENDGAGKCPGQEPLACLHPRFMPALYELIPASC